MSDRDLILAAAKLARTAPETWNEFLGAFVSYTDIQISNCISSPLEELQRAQGRAQNASTLLRLLREALKSADQIERKTK
jgi:hypothetical protein